MDYYYNLLDYVVGGTDSSLIIFFVIVAALLLPLYVAMQKGRKAHRQFEGEKHLRYLEREREILAVIRDNSATIAQCTAVTEGLKNLLEENGASTQQAVTRINERMDGIIRDTTQIITMLGK